jgi:hypothetical protein
MELEDVEFFIKKLENISLENCMDLNIRDRLSHIRFYIIWMSETGCRTIIEKHDALHENQDAILGDSD